VWAMNVKIAKVNFWVILVALLLTGCTNKNPVSEASQQSEDSSGIPYPVVLRPSHLAIISDKVSVYLGSSAESAMKLFTRPADAVAVKTLPTSLPLGYVALGWKTETESLGTISQKDQVVLIIHTQRDISKSKAGSVFDQFEKTYGKPLKVLEKEHSIYKFWEANKQRLMICYTADHSQKWHITVALGVNVLMDALRMNAKDAALDQNQAEKMLGSSHTFKIHIEPKG
jgi:hypothetical protein